VFPLKKDGHLKRDCLVLLHCLRVKQGENQWANVSSILAIEMINAIGHSPISWILDLGATSHIRVHMQDLERSRLLEKREVILRVENGTTVEPLAIGTTFVTLHSRHALTLKDFLYLPNSFRNVVTIPRLVKDGY